MKLVDIKSQIERKPFRPFSIGTTGGVSLPVEENSDILFSPRRPDIIFVFDKGGTFAVLELDSVEILEMP
jgi:hypothetical protein